LFGGVQTLLHVAENPFRAFFDELLDFAALDELLIFEAHLIGEQRLHGVRVDALIFFREISLHELDC